MSKLKKNNIQFEILDPSITEEKINQFLNGEEEYSPLVKSILNSLDNNKKVTRLALEEDPNSQNKYAGLYYEKITLIPDRILKRITIVDDLIATIVRARGNQIRSFGTELQDRKSTGYRFEPKKNGGFESLSKKEKDELLKKTKECSKLLDNCGYENKIDTQDRLSFPTFLYISAMNGVRFGRFATEIIWARDITGQKRFHSFRPADPATIYKAIPHSKAADSVRKLGLQKLQQIKNEKLVPEKFTRDEYAWIQVIDNSPSQAFHSDEMIVHNCYPVTDIEFNGYPLTPVDTAIAAIMTHINITNLNKMYFQNGRASKGMLVIQSDDADSSTIADLKQQFMAAINSVTNAYRMPVIKVGKEDKVEWRPIDSGTRDMEFQYLSDSTTRIILAAYNMSPEELPGYNHLSRGTNQQSLNEGKNEYLLEAGRDVGIRPLLSTVEDFINAHIIHLLDKEVAKYFSIRFHGLDAETSEQENARLEQEQGVYASFNDTLRAVDKPAIPKEWGGDLPLAPAFQAILDKYFTVGQIREYWFGIPDASKDPRWDYVRDQFSMQQQQNLMAQQQMQQQEQLAQQQMQQQQQNPNQQMDPAAGQGKEPSPGGNKPPPKEGGSDLANSVDQLLASLSKSERTMPESRKRLLDKQNEIVKAIMDAWEKDSKVILAEIADISDKNKKE